MAYLDDKMQKLTFPTLTTLNFYAYFPDNGDALSDVLAVGYFTNCRYINTEYGWADGIIAAILDDGFFLLQIGSTEVTATQVSAGGSEVPDLIENVTGIASVDMGADNYALTPAEAICGVLIVSNVGDGTKTLTWPAGTISPVQQLVVTISALNYFGIAHADGGATGNLKPGGMHQVSVSSTYGAYDIDEYVGIDTRGESNGVATLGAGNTDLTDGRAGYLLIADDAAPQTLTINAGLLTQNMKLTVYCSGAGGMTVTAGTATVTGNTVLAAGDSCVIYRDDLTDNYICV